jgi:hypothetical protein
MASAAVPLAGLLLLLVTGLLALQEHRDVRRIADHAAVVAQQSSLPSSARGLLAAGDRPLLPGRLLALELAESHVTRWRVACLQAAFVALVGVVALGALAPGATGLSVLLATGALFLAGLSAALLGSSHTRAHLLFPYQDARRRALLAAVLGQAPGALRFY